MMRHKAADHFWHSTTPASLYEQVVSLEWVLTGEKGTNSQLPLLSCLSGPPGSIIASKKEGQAYLVVAPGSLGLLAWMLEAIELEGVETAYRPIQQSNALVFQHICDLDDWLDIPFEVQMIGNHGGLVMVPSGSAENLCAARVK